MEDISKTILVTLKYVGIFVSFVSGIIGTAFETKEDRLDGSKQLSRFGKIILSCIVAGSFVGAVTQILEDRQKKEDDSKAEQRRNDDVARLAYIIDGTEKLAHPVAPIEWRVQIRYKFDDKSPFFAYVNRLRQKLKNAVFWSVNGDLVPQRTNPRERNAWNLLTEPPVTIHIIKPGVSADNALAPGMSVVGFYAPAYKALDVAKGGSRFDSGVGIDDRDGRFRHNFHVRNSPEVTQISGIVSPLELGGYSVLAESPRELEGVVDEVKMLFPTAATEVRIDLAPIEPTQYMNRSIGVLDGNSIREKLGLTPGR